MKKKLRVMSHNIMHGRGRPALKSPILRRTRVEKNLEAIAAMMRAERPEIILLQEAASSHTKYLERNIRYRHSCSGPHVSIPGVLSYGTAIISRFPLENISSHILRTRTPVLQKGYVIATIAPYRFNFQEIDIVSAHLAFLDPQPKTIRRRQAEFLVENLKACSQQNPLIIGGDFNCDPRTAEKTLHYIAEELNLTIPLVDENGNGHSHPPGTCRDWILASKDFKIKSSRYVPQKLSDHYPIVVDLELS